MLTVSSDLQLSSNYLYNFMHLKTQAGSQLKAFVDVVLDIEVCL